jgi:hypothetical protein
VALSPGDDVKLLPRSLLALVVASTTSCATASSGGGTRELPVGLAPLGARLDGCASDAGEDGAARMRCDDGVVLSTKARTAGTGEASYRAEAYGMAQLVVRLLGLLHPVGDAHEPLERLSEHPEDGLLHLRRHRDRVVSLAALLLLRVVFLARGLLAGAGLRTPGLLRVVFLVVVFGVVLRGASAARLRRVVLGGRLLALLLVRRLVVLLAGPGLLLRLRDRARRAAALVECGLGSVPRVIGHVIAPLHDQEPPLVRRAVDQRDLLDDHVAQAVNTGLVLVVAGCGLVVAGCGLGDVGRHGLAIRALSALSMENPYRFIKKLRRPASDSATAWPQDRGGAVRIHPPGKSRHQHRVGPGMVYLPVRG